MKNFAESSESPFSSESADSSQAPELGDGNILDTSSVDSSHSPESASSAEVAASLPLEEYSMVAQPGLHATMNYKEFLEVARQQPDLYLRNSAQYLADAIKAYGVDETEIYGRVIPVYRCMDGPFLSEHLTAARVPRGQEEVIHEIVQRLEEEGRKARPTKGILLSGVPGGGKNCVVDMMLSTVTDYANNHPEGARWRLALRFSDADTGLKKVVITPPQKQAEVVEGASRGDALYLSSPTNVNPIALLDKTRPFLKDSQGNYVRGKSQRDLFLESCDQDGVNADFIMAATMDETLARAYEAAVDYYMTHETGGNREKACEIVQERHVVVERWSYYPDSGEGVLTRMPHLDPQSDARALAGPSRAQRPPRAPSALEGHTDEIFRFSGPLLKADVVHFEDMLMLVRAPQELLQYGHLNALLERGLLQVIAHEDQSRLFTVTKDLTVFGTVNDVHIQSLREGPSFQALFDRFHVITCPLIRDHSKEAEAHRPGLELMLGDELSLTPHALEVASLFFVSTRLLDPQTSHYLDIDGSLTPGYLASRLSGVAKALYLGMGGDTHATREALNLLLTEDDHLTASDMRILQLPEMKDTFGHEYQGEVMRNSAALYDGGFGISTRIAAGILEKIVQRAKAEGSDVTVRHVIDELKERLARGFAYFDQPSATLDQIKQQQFAALCREKGIGQAELEAFVDAGGSLTGEGKRLWDRAVERAEENFPLRPPKELLSEVEFYAKQLVRADVFEANGLSRDDELNHRLATYVMNLAAYQTKGAQIVPVEFRRDESQFAERTEEEALFGHNEMVMQSLEDELDVAPRERVEFRNALWGKVASWVVRSNSNPRKTANGPVSLQEDFEDLFREEAFAEILGEMKLQEEHEQEVVLRGFVARVTYYHQHPDRLESDLNSDEHNERATRYLEVCARLERLGYSLSSIPKVVPWAFS